MLDPGRFGQVVACSGNGWGMRTFPRRASRRVSDGKFHVKHSIRRLASAQESAIQPSSHPVAHRRFSVLIGASSLRTCCLLLVSRGRQLSCSIWSPSGGRSQLWMRHLVPLRTRDARLRNAAGGSDVTRPRRPECSPNLAGTASCCVDGQNLTCRPVRPSVLYGATLGRGRNTHSQAHPR